MVVWGYTGFLYRGKCGNEDNSKEGEGASTGRPELWTGVLTIVACLKKVPVQTKVI